MAYKSTGFTDVVNAESHGLTSTCEIFFPGAYPVGFNFITDNTSPYFSTSSVGYALVAYSAGTNFGDLWTTITSYNPSAVETVTTVQVSSNVLTITLSAPTVFVPGQSVTFSSGFTAAFLDGQTVTVSTAVGSQFTAAFTNADYGPTADGGTATSAAGVVVADNAISDTSDFTFGKGFGFFDTNA